MKKTVFRPHIILLIEGRLFLLLLLGVFATFDCWALWSMITDFSLTALLACLLLGAISAICGAICIPYFWHRCFEKLIITDTHIIWRCLFLKPHKIALADIRYANIHTFKEGNAVKNDFYHTGFESILLSADPVKDIRIDKIRTNERLIKFMCTQKLCQALGESLPEPYNRLFKIKVEYYNYQIQKRQKRKAKANQRITRKHR